uniref:DNA repair and recombination protein RAD54-like n=1 Tax=Heligmosomoides polygyrus TaxID=6339 RepID=A0A183GG48_HELPZ
LVLIGLLRKAANHPAILFKKLSGTPEQEKRLFTLFADIGELSKVFQTLDMLAALFSPLGLTVLRLDGQTPVQERQALVTRFNSEKSPENVFLLSTKAGGVGLNLTGASRLILFDSDWNPALDLQAMARIWRPGQTKQCHIYRLVTAVGPPSISILFHVLVQLRVWTK